MTTKVMPSLAYLLLLGACSTSGGQSGTDGAGSYYCHIKDTTGTPVSLDHSIDSFSGCTALGAVTALQHATTFDCGSLGELELAVGEATAAHELSGLVYNDTGCPGQGTPCSALAVEAPIRITSANGSLALDSAGFTSAHLCSDFDIDGAAQDAAGKTIHFHVDFATNPGSAARCYALRLTVEGETTLISCNAVRPEGAGGADGCAGTFTQSP